jgi:hypothetical protein
MGHFAERMREAVHGPLAFLAAIMRGVERLEWSRSYQVLS